MQAHNVSHGPTQLESLAFWTRRQTRKGQNETKKEKGTRKKITKRMKGSERREIKLLAENVEVSSPVGLWLCSELTNPVTSINYKEIVCMHISGSRSSWPDFVTHTFLSLVLSSRSLCRSTSLTINTIFLFARLKRARSVCSVPRKSATTGWNEKGITMNWMLSFHTTHPKSAVVACTEMHSSTMWL